MSLLFNMLSKFVIAFLPRSKHLLISWLKSPSTVILEPPKIKSVTVSTVSASIHHEGMGLDAMIFIFWMLSFKPAFSLSTLCWGSFFYLYFQWIQHYLLKNLSFFHWIAFAPLSKINWAHLWISHTVVLEKTLESPLDSKEIKPVNPKGNQSWIFTGRTDAKAEALILWPPDVNSWLIRKDPDKGKDWRQEEKQAIENEMVGCHHQINGHEFEQTQGDSEG